MRRGFRSTFGEISTPKQYEAIDGVSGNAICDGRMNAAVVPSLPLLKLDINQAKGRLLIGS